MNPDITFIESDLPGMIHQKQQLVQQLLDERPNLHFMAIDATQRPNPLSLPIEYFHPDKPVAIVCEGLLMYLTFPMLEVLDQLHSASVLGIDLEVAKSLLATTPIFALTLA